MAGLTFLKISERAQSLSYSQLMIKLPQINVVELALFSRSMVAAVLTTVNKAA